MAGEENERDRGLCLSQGRVDLAQFGRRRRVDVGHHHDHVHVLSKQGAAPIHRFSNRPPDTACTRAFSEPYLDLHGLLEIGLQQRLAHRRHLSHRRLVCVFLW